MRIEATASAPDADRIRSSFSSRLLKGRNSLFSSINYGQLHSPAYTAWQTVMRSFHLAYMQEMNTEKQWQNTIFAYQPYITDLRSRSQYKYER